MVDSARLDGLEAVSGLRSNGARCVHCTIDEFLVDVLVHEFAGAFAAGSHTPTVGVTRKYGPVRLALDLGDASRRAAKYGLSAAGPVATDAMAAALAAAVAAQAWGQVPDVAHVLGQCSGDQTAVAAPSLGCGHPEAVSGAQGTSSAQIFRHRIPFSS